MGSTDTGALDGAAQDLASTKTATATPSPGGSGLTGPVGIGGLNAPDDVWKVSSALTDNGLMEAPQTGADNTLYKGIIGAQERMNGTLKRDGLVNPGGPTERTFTRLAGQGFVKGATADPDTVYAATPERTPPPGRLPEGSSAQALARRRQRARAEADARERQQRINEMERARAERTRLRAAKAALGRDPGPRSAPAARPPAAAGRLATSLGRLAGNALAEVVETATGGGTGAPTPAQDGTAKAGHDGTVPARPAPLTAAQAAANRRTADALGRYQGVGDLPTFTADAIDTDPARAVPEVADLIGRVRRRDPDQARELLDRTAARIAPANRAFVRELWNGGVGDADRDGEDAGTSAGTDNGDGTGASRGAGTTDAAPSSATPQPSSAPPPGAVSQDEHGTWYDDNGDPVEAPGNPLLHRAQMPVPAPAMGAGAGAGAGIAAGRPATAAEVQRALDRAGRDLRDWWDGLADGDARTDMAPKLPGHEEFPAGAADAGDGRLPGRPADPVPAIDPPPYEMPVPGQYDGSNTPPSRDQSGDLPQGTILPAMDVRPDPYINQPGKENLPATQKHLDNLPDGGKIVDKTVLSDGTITHDGNTGISVETGRPASQFKDDWADIVREYGGDPNGPDIEDRKDGNPDAGKIYTAPDGTKVMWRYEGGKPTLDVNVPNKTSKRHSFYQIKRRYDP